MSRSFRPTQFVLLLCGILASRTASADCVGEPAWNQKLFASDAVYYATGDLDGDGRAEILSASATTLSVRQAADPSTAVPIYSDDRIGPPVVADVNGDGRLDLVLPNSGDNKLVVLPGNGNRTFGSAVNVPLAYSPSRVATGNFIGNAAIDIAVIGDTSTLLLMQGDGTGAFAPAGSVILPASPHRIIAANFDGDAHDDVAVSHIDAATIAIFFSSGDGTGTTVSIDDGVAGGLAAGDIDNDGDFDIITTRPLAGELGALHNNSNRTFTGHTVEVVFGGGAARDIALGDFSGDGKLDYFAAIENSNQYVRGFGLGDGSFSGTIYRSEPYSFAGSATSVASGDFTGDGTADFLIEESNLGTGKLFITECETWVLITGQRIFSVGDVFDPEITLLTPTYGGEPPTGTVTLIEGSRSYGSFDVRPYPARPPFTGRSVVSGWTIDDLSPGVHEIVMQYSGDTNYASAENTTYVNVTTHTTTTTLTSSHHESVWGEDVSFTANVTSSKGDAPIGFLTLIAGTIARRNGAAPAATWTIPWLPAGTHTIQALLEFSETHPRSQAAAVTIKVAKAPTSFELRSGLASREGEAAIIAAVFRTQFGAAASGNLKLMEGTTVLDTETIGPYIFTSASFAASGLSRGVHRLRLVYDGDSNALPASLEFDHTVQSSSVVPPPARRRAVRR